MICPKSGIDCPDDLCHGAGCVEMNNYPMLDRCGWCGGTIDDEGDLDLGTCTCTDEYDFDEMYDQDEDDEL